MSLPTESRLRAALLIIVVIHVQQQVCLGNHFRFEAVVRMTKTEITCDDQPCSVNAYCEDNTSNKAKRYNCTCKPGFFGDGFICYQTPCYSSPCLNNGICSNGTAEEPFYCACPIGYKGKRCEKTVIPFGKPVPDRFCKNDGSCIYGNDKQISCKCIEGFSGERCQETGLNCAKHPCKNGGVCQKTSSKPFFYCKCQEGYTGVLCQDKRNELCLNDGKFEQVKDENKCVVQSCNCLPEFKGPKCAEKEFNCSLLPCRNGGSCVQESGIFVKCVCKKGFGGVLCQEREYQSYLNFPRIHFAGTFQADVSTVNNDKLNYDTQNFVPSDTRGSRGGWNPTGSGNWRFVDVSVTRVCYPAGYCRYKKIHDSIIDAKVKDGNYGASAKLVDIDPEAQVVSEIWGLSVEVDGFFKGDFQRTSFQYMWEKMPGAPGVTKFGATYRSVLTNVQFGSNLEKSRIARDFHDSIGVNQKLSICFHLDMFNGDGKTNNFTFGRIVGSIGITGYNSPPYFIYGRMLKPLPGVRDLTFTPFVVKEDQNKLFIDLGNSLGIDRYGDILKSVGRFSIGLVKDKSDNQPTCLDNITWIDEIYYKEWGGYKFTSGIYTIMSFSRKTEEELRRHQVIIAKITDTGGCDEVVLAEDEYGINIHPKSRWVFRTEYDKVVNALLFVTVFGQTPGDNNITIRIEESKCILDPSERNPKLITEVKPLGNGTYEVTIHPSDPKNIRKYIDGQMYAMEYVYNDCRLETDSLVALNQAIFLLVWNRFDQPKNATWLGHISPIFQQYANLYPVMKINFMDLGNYYDVIEAENKKHILNTMQLDRNDPNYMPVTRDLSPNKTDMITKWLSADKPALGVTRLGITVDTLKYLLQTALQLEHATIPPYLTGFLSIKPGRNREVKDLLHSIMIDEMFHMAQVSNILNAVEGNPDLLRPDFVLPYPSYLPGGIQPNVAITIDKISIIQIQDVYMAIEKPFHELEEHGLLKIINIIEENIYGNKYSQEASRSSKCSEKHFNIDYRGCRNEVRQSYESMLRREDIKTTYNTIGQLYQAIILVLVELTNCGQRNDIFSTKKTQLLGTPRLINVTDFKTALEAIKIIVEQGEGASPCNPLMGQDSSKISHFFKFSSIVHKRFVKAFTPKEMDNLRKNRDNVTLHGPKVVDYLDIDTKCHGSYSFTGSDLPFYEDGVWPIVQNPQMSKYKEGSRAYILARSFNQMYSRLLHTLQSVFDGNTDLFGDAMGLMKTLTVYGNRLVQTPIDENGNPEIGPNAGPTYTMD